MFYPVFAVFMVLVVIYIAVAVIEYGTALSMRGSAGMLLFAGALLLLVLALWWTFDAVRALSPTRGIELRARPFSSCSAGRCSLRRR